MRKIKRENILGFYFYQKRSLLTDLRSITWFFKTSFKTTYFNTVFMLFLCRYQSKKMWKQHFSTKLDKVYRVVYELSYLVKKKILTFFLVRVSPVGLNAPNFFLNKIWQFIHQSKALIELMRNILFPNIFWVIFGLKNPKNSVKISLFKDVLKNQVLGPKTVKINCFW